MMYVQKYDLYVDIVVRCEFKFMSYELRLIHIYVLDFSLTNFHYGKKKFSAEKRIAIKI